METWVLVLTLLTLQQEVGTPVNVKIEHFEFAGTRGSPSDPKNLCDAAKAALLKTHDHIGTEPETDYEAPDDKPSQKQPVSEQFELLRTYGTCFRVK